MKTDKKHHTRTDDSLFGLLSNYKIYNTYIRVLVSEEDKRIVIQLTDNPGNWIEDEVRERYRNYHPMRRLELGIYRLFIKYVLPSHLVNVMGPELGIRLSRNRFRVYDELDEKGIYTIEVPLRYRKRAVEGVVHLVRLTARKKYEILEKSLSRTNDQET